MKKQTILGSLKCLKVVLLFNLILPVLSLAQEKASMRGGGSTGGGVTVDIDSRPALRDLVDKTVCKWISAREFQKTYAVDSKTTVERIKKVHWYFGDIIEREIDSLTVCLTEGKLKKIDVTDEDSVTIYKEKESQVAIRLNDFIFVDMSIFRRMKSNVHQNFLFLHEIGHSFLPLNVPRRNESLRSFVKLLYDGFNTESLALNMTANHLNVPATTLFLDAEKTKLLTVFQKDIPYMKRFDLARSLSYLKTKIWVTDAERILGVIKHLEALSEKIKEAMYLNNFDDVRILYLENRLTYDSLVLTWDNLLVSALSYALLNWKPTITESTVNFLLSQGVEPTLGDMRAYVYMMKGTDHYLVWLYKWETNPKWIYKYSIGKSLVSKIPTLQLKQMVQDPVIRSCSELMEMISARLNGAR